jgi:hypothetical protein
VGWRRRRKGRAAALPPLLLPGRQYLADGSTVARRVSDADKRASDYDR